MAPLPESRKRSSSAVEDNQHHLKRQKRYYHHVHATRIKQASDTPHILNDPLSIEHQLRRSIALVLNTIGFSAATPAALDSFTSATEEYMNHLLTYVRTSMEAGKRTRAIPFDFEYALHANQLTFRSLITHLKPPISDDTGSGQTIVAPSMKAREVIIKRDEQLMEQFSKALQEPETQTRLPYAARKLPILPSRHTYKATPAVSNRVRDAKSIRERATEESRLGEEALRRLVSAAQVKAKGYSTNHGDVTAQTPYQKCWEMLLEQGQADEDRVDLKRTDFSGPPINSESRYWRKGIRHLKKPSTIGVGRDLVQ